MSNEHCVIVGASHGAASLAAALRTEGWEGAISIVGDEPHLPYHRPPLSKAYFCGDKSGDEILIRPDSFYESNNIDMVLGSRVVDIDLDAKKVVLHDGGDIPFTKLALTTGAKVRKIPIPGSELNGVYYLRDLKDVDQIKKYVTKGKRAVIVGGGYIGLETAASLRKLGMEVTVLEALPRVLQRVTAPEVSAFYTRVHREEGVDLRTEVGIEAITGDNKVRGVKLADGNSIDCDLVVIGVGVIPETELAEKAGLKIDNGIVVDEHARTSHPDIVAAGDCTSHYNPIYKTTLRLESVQNATDQARIAAKTLCGKPVVYNALPWFWSDQYDLKLQIAGLSQGFDQVVVRGSVESGRSFAAFYYKEGRMIAVDAVNRPKEFMMSKRALTEGKTADPKLVADESVEVKDIFIP
ncbi:Pyridine nucleotide-disulfide oxidoreductase/Reductase C-terminal [Spongiibacter sp. IMCC21906]|jgi:3-phenylpropionate/trans-cinnamate dioxygenase ferredoxin reductase subunit|uniref:NAD(P)/FAD-dependent oxidoreductase n=1 Tax=Spongiibacter sp. IMCC21906 TaxID=1620392 RepID=UPI00062E018F|nr:FAD-dependent oxidoreductase [Spongiibacter sp. IMCC21906]AKH69360.1 Pyridine nucleotide-disulfide oxidoreductase/Reductase C-terminal [Spongiibacter sp. IMCC21906]